MILEETTIQQVTEIESWIKLELEIMNNPGLAKFIKPGYRSLFYGPPGTGKTLTASLIGRYTGLTVYR
ncbi:MAG: AAA family ATPase, partial [Saprospiraceae bacterium]